MANKLTKDLEIMFETFVNDFEAQLVISKAAKTFSPDSTDMQRAGDVVYRPQHYHMASVRGLDLSSATANSLLQRMVPSVMRAPNNIIYELDAKEMRDEQHRTDAGRGAAQRLAADIDIDVANEVGLRATNIQTVTAQALANGTAGKELWNAAAKLKANMTQIGVPAGLRRSAFWNADSSRDLASELGQRQTVAGAVFDAYKDAQIPNVAGFQSFEVDNSPYLAAGSTATITLAAVPAHKIEVQANNPDDYSIANMTNITPPPDNRQGDITLSAAHGLKAGDAFTIDGVTMVHRITLADTGKPQVFRVLAVSGTTVTVSPKLLPVNNADVPSRPYANIAANPLINAPITVVNKVGSPADVLWADGAVELMLGRLAFPTGEGVQVMTSTTKQGAYVIMAYSFDIKTAKTTCRFTTMYGANVLIPEHTALILRDQTA